MWSVTSATAPIVAAALLALAAPIAGDDGTGPNAAAPGANDAAALERSVRRYFDEVLNERRAQAVDVLFDPRATENGRPFDRDAFRRHLADRDRPFDLEIAIDDLVVLGDTVVARTSSRGTHTGSWFGIPATRRPVTMWGIDVFRFRGGKIVEHWHAEDRLPTMVQLGVFPLPKEALDAALSRTSPVASERR